MYGTVASAFSPIPYSIVITFLTGSQNYDWADFQNESLALEKLDADLTTTTHNDNEHDDDADAESVATSSSSRDKAKELKRWGRIAAFWSIATFLGHWVIWPLPMYGSRYVFGKGFFTAWVIVGIIWLWLTLLMVIFYPLIDGGIQQTVLVFRNVFSSPVGKLRSGEDGKEKVDQQLSQRVFK